jgi:hypothetical protein
MAKDRATVAATAIMAAVMAHIRGGKITDIDAMRAAVTAIVGEEIDDVARQTRGEREPPDDT